MNWTRAPTSDKGASKTDRDAKARSLIEDDKTTNPVSPRASRSDRSVAALRAITVTERTIEGLVVASDGALFTLHAVSPGQPPSRPVPPGGSGMPDFIATFEDRERSS